MKRLLGQSGTVPRLQSRGRPPRCSAGSSFRRHSFALKKEEQEQDLLVDIERADNETQNAIEEKEAEAKINGGTSGNVRTGNGRKAGRPDEGKNTDRWGNRPNENNWKKFNQTH